MAPESTCWTVIRAAAGGDAAARESFARRYAPVVRAYLAARWRTGPLRQQLDDAVQDVFLACLKPDGLLDRADAGWPGGFRPFLYGAARNVARRFEERAANVRAEDCELDDLPADDPTLSRAFDRAWAAALLRAAAERQAEIARKKSPAARRRVELLRLRFYEGLPIRAIAERWGEDAARLHHEYATAREEFRAALAEVVAFHQPGSPEAVERAVADLLAALG
jgi:RNA polymerase sigma-70 factor (ECF subfamily)